MPGLAVQLVLAGAANCCGALATNPLDVVKVRQQLARAPFSLLSGFEYKEGIISGLKRVLVTDGVRRGLYAGLAPSLLRESTYSALRLGLYGPIKDTIWSDSRDPPIMVRITAGAISGCIGCAVASPTDLIKVRLQAVVPEGEAPPRRVITTAVAIITREGGVTALWQGCGANMQRAALLTAAQVGSYDAVKGRIRSAAASSRYPVDDSDATVSATPRLPLLAVEGAPLHAAAAVVAGLIAAVVTTPVDTAKSRIMAQRGSHNDLQRETYYTSTADCIRRVALREGLFGLYAGFAATWARLSLHTVVSFMVYERLRRAAGMKPM